MKKVLKWIGITFGGLVAIFIVIAFTLSPEQKAAATAAREQKQAERAKQAELVKQVKFTEAPASEKQEQTTQPVKIRDGNATTKGQDLKLVPAFPQINLDDLKVDIKGLIGKRLSVTAQIQVMGELNMLKSDEDDMTPVWAVTENLPREDRKKLANGCQMLLCRGQFYGVVRQVPLGLGLVVEKVVWQ